MRWRALALFAVGIALWGGALPASAVEMPSLDQLQKLGSAGYADELVGLALERNGLVADAEPEGKTLERVVAVPYDVIIPEDPWPVFPAMIHATTLPQIAEQELLIPVGEKWDARLARETERNLRANLFVSFSRVVACRGSAPDRVVGLIVTKDLWSLRPGLSFLLVGTSLQYLELFVAEHNLFGRRKIAGLDFAYDPVTLLLGERVRDPRVWGSRIAVGERADVIWNHRTGALEGGIGQLSVERPIFSLATQWGWFLGVDYTKNIFRQYQGSQVLPIVSNAGETMLLQYRQERLELRAQATRAWGEIQKFELTGGWLGNAKAFSFYNSDQIPFSTASVDYMNATYIPRSESMGMLFFQARYFQAEFVQLYDIDRFALPEDYRLGPEIKFEQRVATPAFGWGQSFYEPDLTLEWNHRWADNLFQFNARARTRYQPGLVADSSWVNQVLSFKVKNISPRIGFFRVAASARLTRRFLDLDRALDTLGGNNGIRGFPAEFLYGQQVWGGNIEVRTIPYKLWAFYIGGTAFLDMGNAFGSVDRPGFYASSGVGLRVGLPQFNRSVLRVDFAMPWLGPHPIPSSYVVATFGQAF